MAGEIIVKSHSRNGKPVKAHRRTLKNMQARAYMKVMGDNFAGNRRKGMREILEDAEAGLSAQGFDPNRLNKISSLYHNKPDMYMEHYKFNNKPGPRSVSFGDFLKTASPSTMAKLRATSGVTDAAPGKTKKRKRS